MPTIVPVEHLASQYCTNSPHSVPLQKECQTQQLVAAIRYLTDEPPKEPHNQSRSAQNQNHTCFVDTDQELHQPGERQQAPSAHTSSLASAEACIEPSEGIEHFFFIPKNRATNYLKAVSETT